MKVSTVFKPSEILLESSFGRHVRTCVDLLTEQAISAMRFGPDAHNVHDTEPLVPVTAGT